MFDDLSFTNTNKIDSIFLMIYVGYMSLIYMIDIYHTDTG